jgi:DNA-binding transcriptional LysR family regulator
MEIHRIVQFRMIVETRNLRKASELLGISHSGLSKSMKTLQDELGVTLFYPSGRGVVISDEGTRFYERSKRFLDEYALLVGQNDVNQSQTVRIGSFEVFTSHFIGPLLKNYLPQMPAEIHDLIPGRLEEALLLKKVDIGITYEPIPRQGIEYVKVASLTMGAFAAHGCFDNEELANIPFIVPVLPLEGAPSGVKGLDAWPDEKIPRKILYRVDLLATGLELTRQGLAAIFIPHFVARLHNNHVIPSHRLHQLKLPRALTNVKREVFIVKRESTGEDKTIRQIARALRDICSENSSI